MFMCRGCLFIPCGIRRVVFVCACSVPVAETPDAEGNEASTPEYLGDSQIEVCSISQNLLHMRPNDTWHECDISMEL